MPCHSNNQDKSNAERLAKHFGFELKEFDLTELYDGYVKQFKFLNDTQDNEVIDANINIKPRLRMATLYYYAAYLSKKNKGLYIVPGTSNKCELYVGYFTKGGDNVADIQVLADFTVEEVILLGKAIGVPDDIVNKVPDDGLSGLSDEDKLGVKYAEIADVIENNGQNVSEQLKRKLRPYITIIYISFIFRHLFKRSKISLKIGIFGGSFNPPHVMHKNLALY